MPGVATASVNSATARNERRKRPGGTRVAVRRSSTRPIQTRNATTSAAAVASSSQPHFGVWPTAVTRSSRSATSRSRSPGNSSRNSAQNCPDRKESRRSPSRAWNCVRRRPDICSAVCAASTDSSRASLICASSARLFFSSCVRCAATSGASLAPAGGAPNSLRRAATLVNCGVSASAVASALDWISSASPRCLTSSASSVSSGTRLRMSSSCLRAPASMLSTSAGEAGVAANAGARHSASSKAAISAAKERARKSGCCGFGVMFSWGDRLASRRQHNKLPPGPLQQKLLCVPLRFAATAFQERPTRLPAPRTSSHTCSQARAAYDK